MRKSKTLAKIKDGEDLDMKAVYGKVAAAADREGIAWGCPVGSAEAVARNCHKSMVRRLSVTWQEKSKFLTVVRLAIQCVSA